MSGSELQRDVITEFLHPVADFVFHTSETFLKHSHCLLIFQQFIELLQSFLGRICMEFGLQGIELLEYFAFPLGHTRSNWVGSRRILHGTERELDVNVSLYYTDFAFEVKTGTYWQIY